MFLFRLTFWLARFGVKLALATLLLGTILAVLYASFWLPDVGFLAETQPETTAFIERARGRPEPVRVRRTWVPLDKISPQLIDAVRIAEDDRFFLHNGFDFTEIKHSIEKNLKEGRFARGGSTLTQQLAKNLYLSPDKTLRRKFDEMLLTWKLEKNLTKDRILELYLNVVEWGNGCFGAEAASRFYFSKPALSLTEREAANLAARLPNPDYFSSYSGEKKRRERERMILARMKKAGPAPGKANRLNREKKDRTANPETKSKTPSHEEEKSEPMILEIAKRIEPLRQKLTEVFTEPVPVSVLGEELPEETVRNESGPIESEPAPAKESESWKPIDRKVAAPPPRVTVQGPESAPPETGAPKERFKPVPRDSGVTPEETDERSRSDRLREQLARLQNALSD
jgi:monofunctional biosynthetic peptidoglycan transglycosylase